MPFVSEDRKLPDVDLTTMYRVVSSTDGEIIRFTGKGTQSDQALVPAMESKQARRDGWQGFLEQLIQSRYRQFGTEYRFELVPVAADYGILEWHRERTVVCTDRKDVSSGEHWTSYQLVQQSEAGLSADIGSASARNVWLDVLQSIRISELEREVKGLIDYLDRLPLNYETRKVTENAERTLKNPDAPNARFFSAVHGKMGGLRLKVEVSSAGVIVRTDNPDEHSKWSIDFLRELIAGCQMPPLRNQDFAEIFNGKMMFQKQALPFAEQEARVARAICIARSDDPDAPGHVEGHQYRWQDYIKYAKAAIDSL